MTNSELERECSLAEAEGCEEFLVILPQIRYGKRVRIAPGLVARSLGHYPREGGPGAPDTTHLRLNCADVRRYLQTVGQASKPDHK